MHTLRHQRLEPVHHEFGGTPVTKAACHLSRQPDGAIRLPQQYRPGIRRHRTTVESTHNLTPPEAFKVQLSGATVCLHRLGLDQSNCLSHNHFL